MDDRDLLCASGWASGAWAGGPVVPYLLLAVQEGVILVVVERVVQAVHPARLRRQLEVLGERPRGRDIDPSVWKVAIRCDVQSHICTRRRRTVNIF